MVIYLFVNFHFNWKIHFFFLIFSNEIEKLSKMIREWKSKYHYSKIECTKLTILQQKLQEYATVNGLI